MLVVFLIALGSVLGPAPVTCTNQQPKGLIRSVYAERATCRNATQLWREIKAQGYRGSAVMVRLKVGDWRATDGRKDRHLNGSESGSARTKIRPPSPRKAMWLLLGDAGKRTDKEVAMREKLLVAGEEVQKVTVLALKFQAIVRERKAEQLKEWLMDAKASGITELAGFANGIVQDQAAVEAALCYDWSNGQVEGQVNRIKAIKRALYGRAKFDLLRKKILRAA
jgi:transposase